MLTSTKWYKLHFYCFCMLGLRWQNIRLQIYFEVYDESVRFNNEDKADFANAGKIVNAVFLLSLYVLLRSTKHWSTGQIHYSNYIIDKIRWYDIIHTR